MRISPPMLLTQKLWYNGEDPGPSLKVIDSYDTQSLRTLEILRQGTCVRSVKVLPGKKEVGSRPRGWQWQVEMVERAPERPSQEEPSAHMLLVEHSGQPAPCGRSWGGGGPGEGQEGRGSRRMGNRQGFGGLRKDWGFSE